MIKEKPIAFAHCEKTAGSSLITAYYRSKEKESKRDKSKEFMWFPQWKKFFPLNWLPLTNTDESTDTLKQNSGTFLPFIYKVYFDLVLKMLESKAVDQGEISMQDFEVLHGHFTLYELSTMINLDSVNIAFIVRDPLERMVSHYRHFQRVGWYQIPTFRQVFERGEAPSSFTEFALHPDMINYQSQVLFGFSDKVDFIGRTDELDLMLQSMGIEQSAEHRNTAPGGNNMDVILSDLQVTDSFIDKFKDQHARDYKLFQTQGKKL